jgi:nitrite reductase/ring-hydroxylating ferredoxin subunit
MSKIVQQIKAELARAARQPHSAAHAMSSPYYTSSDYLEVEREELFRKQWVCIGHVGEVPSAGDYFTTELVDEQLVVVRGGDGVVRVLSNVCRHRGHMVAQGKGRVSRSFVCSYHAWTYGLDGKLQRAPLISEGGSFDRRACRLPEFASTVWQGFIFVNLAGNAAPLGPGLEAIEPNIRNYQQDRRHFLYCAEEVWATNWKCLVENFMEGYHLSPTHANTLHAITPTRLCEKLPDGPAFTGYRANFNPSCPERGPFNETLTEKERRSDVFYCIYPSFVIGICPHFTLHMCVRPLEVGKVGIRWGVTGVMGDPECEEVADYIKLCDAFCEEDKATLERLQRSLKTQYYTPGPLAPDAFEGTIWDLTRYAARRVATEGGRSVLISRTPRKPSRDR